MSFLSNHPRNRLVRLAVASVRASGFSPVVAEGKAYRISWCDGDGVAHSVPVSRSPTSSLDERAVLARVRHALRASKKARA